MSASDLVKCMKIAIGSGKGGTGKTTVAVALALASTEPAQYLDCDVEEPNGHIFFKPVLKDKKSVALKIPFVDSALCTGCGACDRIFQFNAIISLASTAGAQCVARLPYNSIVTQAQILGQTVADDPDGPLTETLNKIWKQLCQTV